MKMPRWRRRGGDVESDGVGLEVLEDDGEVDDEDEDRPRKRWWKRADADEPADSSEHVRHEWTGAAVGLTRLVRVVVWVFLAMGPLAFGMFLLSPSPMTTAAPTGTADGAAGERTAVTAFAEDFVTTWLSATRGEEDLLQPYVADVAGVSLPVEPVEASGVSTAQVEQLDGLWSVTVAVTVMEGKPVAPVRRYFQTAVLYAEGAVRAQTYPAQVAAPSVAVPHSLGYREVIGSGHPIFGSTEAFLAAMLTGAGEVSRYTTPGAAISAVLPPPYARISITEVFADRPVDDDPAALPANGDQVRVLVTVEAEATKARQTSLQYALTLAARDGRWEVAEIDLTPALAPTADEQSSSPDPATGQPS